LNGGDPNCDLERMKMKEKHGVSESFPWIQRRCFSSISKVKMNSPIACIWIETLVHILALLNVLNHVLAKARKHWENERYSSNLPGRQPMMKIRIGAPPSDSLSRIADHDMICDYISGNTKHTFEFEE
jgi:hypothetical protein